MKGKTHAGVGIVTYLLLYNKLPDKVSLTGLAVVTFASLLPDIDHPKSIINQYILPFKNKMTKVVLYACSGIIFLWYSFLYDKEPYIKTIGIFLILIAVSSHRKGLTHSLMGMILFAFQIAYIGNVYEIRNLIYYFMLGYGLHLLCDMATNRGVPLLYPFKEKNIKLPITFKTNSFIGNFIETLIIVAGLLYVIYSFPSIFS
ncbi:MAG: metal-dependent hydrolase [Clostridium lundense]|nr:metal-dependent hydrolase [Clostridium lundense]